MIPLSRVTVPLPSTEYRRRNSWLRQTSPLTERAVTQYGMSPSWGPVAFAKPAVQFLEGSAISPEVAAEIDRQVKHSLDQAHAMARDILSLNRTLLESTTQILLDTEVLEGNQLQGILAQLQAPAGLGDWLAKG